MEQNKEDRMNQIFRRAVLLVCAAASAVCLGGCSHKEEEWEKKITEETVYVDGLEGEYTFLFLTDSHVVIQDKNASQQEQEFADQRYAMFYNEEGVAAKDQFPAWVRYANEMEVDAVLLGGDIIDSPSDANVEWLRGQLAKLKMPYLYVPGNHDWTYPWDYMTDYGKETYLSKLSDMMQGHAPLQSLAVGELLLVGVDDSSNQVNPDAISGYEDLLRQGKPVIVMTHVPFATDTLSAKAALEWENPTVIGEDQEAGIWPNDTSCFFRELTTARDTPVKLLLSGHVHLYDDSVINGETSVRQIVGDGGYEGCALLLHVKGR